MSLNINNPEVEYLLFKIIDLTGESKTEAIRKALDERYQRLVLGALPPRNEARLLAFLENEIWPQVPPEFLGRPILKEEENGILGYGDLGI